VSRLVRLWTEDGQSRFREEDALPPPAPARRVHAEESPPGSTLSWHDAPCRQYVITLTGTLRFTTRDGDDFVLRPGDVLLAEDTAGGGHRWELVDDQPWRRVYVELD
jgi:quercetin dioxygenase-like cupin family protein